MRGYCCGATAAHRATTRLRVSSRGEADRHTTIEADPEATMYALRHSSIVRMLKANVPIRLVASLHNTLN